MRGFFREVDNAVPEGPEKGFSAICMGIVDFSGCIGGFDWGGECGDYGGKGGGAIEVRFDVVVGVLLGGIRSSHFHGCGGE